MEIEAQRGFREASKLRFGVRPLTAKQCLNHSTFASSPGSGGCMWPGFFYSQIMEGITEAREAKVLIVTGSH